MPPKEWPMMIGGTPATDRIAASRWSSVSGTVSSAMTCGFSRSASTSISNPGYPGVSTVNPLSR